MSWEKKKKKETLKINTGLPRDMSDLHPGQGVSEPSKTPLQDPSPAVKVA